MTESIIRLATKIYVTTPDTFTKKEYPPPERPKNQLGNPIIWKLGTERLRNEGSALKYVNEHTTIPVPQVLHCGPDGDGVMSLTVEFVDGILCEDVGDCCRMPPEKAHNTEGKCLECQELGFRNTNEFIETTVLPQLRSLSSDQTGLDGLVIPPPRILEFDNRATWNPKRSSSETPYVFCHGDLSRSNIILDRETLTVKCIIDWECAGHYPAELEGNPWRLTYEEYMRTFQDTDKIQREISLIADKSS
ncbi:kinase-like domain-containing protein [Colletotrichum cereale]|nr:kinase-like domain-containing protein [Colletotrichum cereale]